MSVIQNATQKRMLENYCKNNFLGGVISMGDEINCPQDVAICKRKIFYYRKNLLDFQSIYELRSILSLEYYACKLFTPSTFRKYF